MKTRKELFFKAIREMNISLLEVLLEDAPICEDLRNDLFIERMEDVFLEFKQSKDTYLQQYKGHCPSEYCKEGCKGYIYIGNHSHKYIHVRCKETETEVTQFYPSSGGLEADEITMDTTTSVRFPTIYAVDKVSYDGCYNAIIKQMDAAIADLVRDNDGYLSKHNYIPWVEKYEFLFDEKNRYGCNFRHVFPHLYAMFLDLTTNLQKVDQVKKAQKEYDEINKMEEKEVLKWLVKYEEFGVDIFMFIVDHFDCDVINGFVSSFYHDKIWFYYNDFLVFEKFNTLFSDLYYAKLEEYTTYEKNISFHNSIPDEEKHTIFSLRFHLQQRGFVFSE